MGALKLLGLNVSLILILSILNSAFVLADFTYDSAGNMISDEKYTYEYDGFNRLKAVYSGSELVEQYWYDHEGNRVKKENYQIGETTYYSGDLVRKITSNGINDSQYYYADGVLLAKATETEILNYHPTHLGSTSLITDQNGNVVEK